MGCGASASKAKYVEAERQAAGCICPGCDAGEQDDVGRQSPKASPAKPEANGEANIAADIARAIGATTVEEVGEEGELPAAGCYWWASHAGWIQQRASEILAAYNFFFEHIGLRKGWRTAPFRREEVQAPFQAAAEVVTIVRARLDEQKGEGVILRQLEGSAMNFLWGWSPECRPSSCGEALEKFFRGLVFATLSDGHGLVEGLDTETVEHYINRHPIIAACRASPKARGTGREAADEGLPLSPSATMSLPCAGETSAAGTLGEEVVAESGGDNEQPVAVIAAAPEDVVAPEE